MRRAGEGGEKKEIVVVVVVVVVINANKSPPPPMLLFPMMAGETDIAIVDDAKTHYYQPLWSK